MRYFCLLLAIFLPALTLGCQQQEDPLPADSAAATQTDQTPLLRVLAQGIEAHGGLAQWESMGSLAYDVTRGQKSERHLTALRTRQTIQEGPGYRLGYDGGRVWVEPRVDSFPGDPNFSRGLDFYFFAIPFVLADPGTVHEDLGTVMMDGSPYDAVKVSFEAGVGDSPNDFYIAHFHPETNQLAYLLYTVTYRSGEPNENFSLRAYEEWQEVNGLIVPQKIVSYQWDRANNTIGAQRGETVYSNVTLSVASPEDADFMKPETAEFYTPEMN